MSEIRLFDPSHKRSKIPREIIDLRVWNERNSLQKIQIEIFYTNLTPRSFYHILLYRKDNLKLEKTVKCINSEYLDLSLEQIEEKNLQTGNTKDLFVMKLLDLNSNLICEGCFYRFKSEKMRGRSLDFPIPSKPDEKNEQVDDNRSVISVSSSIFSSISNIRSNFGSNIPSYPKTSSEKSFKNTPIYEYDSNMSISSSNFTEKFLTKKNGFLGNNSNFPLFDRDLDSRGNNEEYVSPIKPNYPLFNQSLDPRVKDEDYSSPDEEYSYAAKSHPTLTDDEEKIEVKNKNLNTSFSSIEGDTKLYESDLKLEKNYYSFVLKITDYHPEDNWKMIRENFYVYPSEKFFVSNHAIRALYLNYKINCIASFKIDINVSTKTRSGFVKCLNYEKDLVDLLTNGLECQLEGKRVRFFYVGNSNSGMRERNFWAIDEVSFRNLEYKKFIFGMGNFSSFNSIEKLSKRFNQFFSSSKETIFLNKNEFCTIEDDFVSSNRNYLFTDGIGLIRMKTCEIISSKLCLEFKCYIFQIRCGGFKGMLVGMSDQIFDRILAKNKINSNQIKVIFRKSQLKFDSNESKLCLNIVSWGSYCVPSASLNSEFLIVLDGLTEGTDLKQKLISIYKSQLRDCEECLTDPRKAFGKLFNSPELNEFMVKYGSIILACRKDLRNELDPYQYKIIKEVILEQYFYNTIIRRKLNIHIEKSRYLVGILDESGTLKEGEIFVSYRDLGGKPQYLNNVPCIVGRTPCYSLSEIRKVKARYVPELEHLVNCVAFPKNGRRPLTNILSGGDLDGDFYFVSWDDIFSCVENSDQFIEYPKSEEKINFENFANIRKELVKYYVKNVIEQDSIGLWHYYLICLYDKSREYMNSNAYMEGVLEVNKAIDCITSTTKMPRVEKKPNWYISGEDLVYVESEKSKSGKFKNLAEVISKKNINFNIVEEEPESFSLLACIFIQTIKHFMQIMSVKDEYLSGNFLSQEDLDILTKDKMISLNLIKSPMAKRNEELVKREYSKYIQNIYSLEKKFKTNKNNNNGNMFVGMVERREMFLKSSKYDQQKKKVTDKFRDFVANLSYYENENFCEDIKNSMCSISGYFFSSRVVGLYLSLKDTDKYQIPWAFYDVLCNLKNYCNNKKHPRLADTMPSYLPMSIPFELIKAISHYKLINSNQY